MIDVSTGKVILNGVSVEGKSNGFGFSVLEKGMDRQAKAVLKGFDKALKEFLTLYPLEVKAK